MRNRLIIIVVVVFLFSLSVETLFTIRGYADDDFYKNILKTHPRIIISEKNITELRKRVEWLLSDLYKRFIGAYHSPERGTSAINRYVYSQGYAYLMTGDKKWADKAIEAMEQVPAYLNAYGSSPDSIADSLEALAIGFDWCYDRIVEVGKKEKFIKLIKEYAEKAQDKFEKDVYTDFHNYALNFVNSVLFAGLALWGEDDSAKGYIEWAMGIMETGYDMNRTTYKTIDSINFVDSACNWESPTYQRHSLFRIIKYVDALDTATGSNFDLWHTTFSKLENAGYYILYMTRPDNLFENLADSAYLNVTYKEMNNLAVLQGKFKNGYFTTFLDKYFRWVSGAFKSEIPLDQGYRFQIFYLIWYDPYLKPKPLEELPLSMKFGDEIILRTGWQDNDTFITFRAGIHWGGHSHLDHGSFTIYKNGPLVIDSGYYDLWGPGNHIWDYWKRTVAHNTITIFDPKEIWSSYAGKRINDGGQRMVYRKFNPPYTDHYGYFSSGSSNEPLSTQYLEEYIEEFKMANIDAFETRGTYDYIRADLTNAYNNPYSGKGNNQKIKASLVQREFIFLRPNYVVILDRVNAIDASFIKSWLLHFGKYSDPVNSAPFIKAHQGWVRPNKGITEYASDMIKIDNGSSRLFCKTLFPYPHKLKLIGGRGYEFWVNGQNISIAAESIREDAEPGAWRLEVQPKNPNKEDIFLHILYPCDSSVESMPEVNRIEVEEGIGLQIADRVVIFSNNKEGLYYQVNGMNTLKHLVCNLGPNTSYVVVIKNLTEKKISRHSVSSTSSGVLEFVTASSGRQGVSIKLSKR